MNRTVTIALIALLLTTAGIYMWPFTKKHIPLNLPRPQESKWDVLQGQHNGEPIIVRRNASIRSLKGHPELPIKIGFAIPLKVQNKGGLPDPAENEAMVKLEDLIEEEVLKDHTAVLAMIITMGTFKEYVFYAKAGTDIGATHRRLMGMVKDYEVQCVGQSDPDWAAYDMF